MVRPLLLVSVVVGGCSSGPAPRAPSDVETSEMEPEVRVGGPTTVDAGGGVASAEPSGPKTQPDANDDYELTRRDCAALGRQLADLIRADETAKLPANLRGKQREAALASIDKAATQRGDPWIEGCDRDLVGKVVERKRLTCAMAARTVSVFDECINGPARRAGEKAE